MGEGGSAPERRALLLERMLFFSDAVFAIVLTLMALEVRLPEWATDAGLMDAIVGIGSPLVAFVLSFALVGIFWLAHLATMRALARFDWPTAAVNLVFLFFVVATPFATSLVARFGNLGMAWRLYCATIVATSLSQSALIVVSHRDELRIVHADHHGRMWARISRTASPGAGFAIGLALSFAGARVLSSFCWVLVPVLILLARRFLPETRARPPSAPAEAAAETA